MALIRDCPGAVDDVVELDKFEEVDAFEAVDELEGVDDPGAEVDDASELFGEEAETEEAHAVADPASGSSIPITPAMARQLECRTIGLRRRLSGSEWGRRLAPPPATRIFGIAKGPDPPGEAPHLVVSSALTVPTRT